MSKRNSYVFIDTLIVIMSMLSINVMGLGLSKILFGDTTEYAEISGGFHAIFLAVAIVFMLHKYLESVAKNISIQRDILTGSGAFNSECRRCAGLEWLEVHGIISPDFTGFKLELLSLFTSPLVHLVIFYLKVPPRASIEATGLSDYYTGILLVLFVLFLVYTGLVHYRVKTVINPEYKNENTPIKGRN